MEFESKFNSGQYSWFFAIWIVVLTLCSCTNSKNEVKVVFKETAGVDRSLEYVEIKMNHRNEGKLFLQDVLSGDLIIGERLSSKTSERDSSSYILPISIRANETKTFTVVDAKDTFPDGKIGLAGEGVAVQIENDYFVADFTTTASKRDKGLHPGQLAGIFIKNRDVLLQRSDIDMHWSPNFQKEGMNYKTMGHLDTKKARIVQRNPYIVQLEKSGTVPEYEEIDLFGTYTFFSGLPYFLFTSTMTFNQNVDLFLLRNDEMTMDSLFTHLVYPKSDDVFSTLPLYDSKKLDSLTQSPLKDDIDWLGFINESEGYGLFSIRLDYDNRNLKGGQSPLFEPHTKISTGRKNGRYWNRRLINEKTTHVPKGSRYHERLAYLVLDDLTGFDKKIKEYMVSLKNPVNVVYQKE